MAGAAANRGLSPQGIEPLYERRDPYQFWRGLAVRLGQSQFWPWETMEDVWDHRLEPVGLTFKQLIEKKGIFGQPEYKRYEKFGFGTPSGKVEIRSSTFEALGCDPMPVYREPPHSPVSKPEWSSEYPLVLITGSRFMPVYHSEQRQFDTVRKEWPDPVITLHPERVAALGIEEGQWVQVTTPQGCIRMRLHLSDAIDPRMADAQHG